MPSFPPHWNLTQPQLIAETFSSRIWKVVREDGSHAVVKALKDFPDVYDELRGGYFLRWRDGVGAVRLIDWVGHDMLLEYADGPLLTELIGTQGDDTATEIAAETLARMLLPSAQSAPSELQPLRERFAALFDKALADRSTKGDSPYIDAAMIADKLLSDRDNIRPLHGDLHHDNIMHSTRGWLIIDPKGVLGDPAFDAGNMFFNPLDQRDRLCLDENRIAFIAQTFGKALGQSPARILDFGFAYGCLSAAWHAEDENDVDETLELNVARALRAVRANL